MIILFSIEMRTKKKEEIVKNTHNNINANNNNVQFENWHRRFASGGLVLASDDTGGLDRRLGTSQVLGGVVAEMKYKKVEEKNCNNVQTRSM